ncbi:uncharacterized protein C6orf141 homolog [Choloepus didactylus]|uniref:uncharacterized protein C6orf141 homolog n=1 Tax=Choloepus didactylus TaxID=27675 RepID=UPI0018A0B9CC|nr:uncharacterized protein C6orf141 homolog [Choloepus didactylus]XP_037699121.1 uncharacterized protein C6orf141 homolog [Choloepus didactylus]XP_037699122.1 uncharacterized protein C6orf141 homolog [Choloepus didactylus]XP_037699123.1 uncharacterized protein C6orf141 homolog [Choloepus didactylus]
MENPASSGVAGPAASHSRPGRAWSFPRKLGRGASLAPGAPNPAAAEASGSRGGAQENRPPARAPGPRAAENLDYENWVREKVVFLLHPERWLGTQRNPAQEEAVNGENLPHAGGDGPELHCPEPDCSSRFPQETRIFGSRVDAPSGAPPRDPAAPPKPVLVRVVDHQVTQEVLRTTWTKGHLTTTTEDRCITAVTFRAFRK